jgi:hypothetical protein
VIASLHGGSPFKGFGKGSILPNRARTAVSTFNYRWDTLQVFFDTVFYFSDPYRTTDSGMKKARVSARVYETLD